MTTTTKPIDWVSLESEFILNEEYPLARTWLREVKKWSKPQIEAGNTQNKIDRWGRKRADFQQKIHEEKTLIAKEQIARIYPLLYQKKIEILNGLLSDMSGLSVREKLLVLKAVKVELNEPTITAVEAKGFKYSSISQIADDDTDLTDEELNEALGFLNEEAM